ncbi:hypothetical protein [Thiorhodospira sibirica]|uniref:hypothetical protein n=1 Tax=Thiorhodospira sibirica TaxID=154347 RepID=UPI00022C5263|nr:hypothetical protein [Thiorhodospira sibirica]
MNEPTPQLRKPFSQSYYPPVPTRLTKHLRVNPLWQLFRFLVLNAKMLRMVRKH